MNQPNHITPDLLDLFESHYLKQLSPEEVTNFEQRLVQDQHFQKNYTAYLVTREVLNQKIEHSLRADLKKWHAETGPGVATTTKSFSIRTIWKYAAAACLLALISVPVLQNHYLNNQIDKMIAQNLPLSGNTTRSDEKTSISSILVKYAEQPAKAIAALEAIPSESPDYYSAQKNLAFFAVREGDCNKTLQHINNAKLASEDTPLALLLCQVKCNELGNDFEQQLNKILSDKDNNDYAEALKIKNMMNGFWWKLLR